MNDFRTQLYRRYVSTFKGEESRRDAKAAASHRAWCEHKYGPFLEHLEPNAPILELGCGAGDLLAFLQEKGFSHVKGVDISEEQVRIAQERGLNAAVGDVFEVLSSAGERFGAILAVDFLEHFSKEELTRLVPGIRAALQEGGTLLLQTPNGQGLFPGQVIYGDLSHLTILTPSSLQQLLRPEGFDDFRFAETGPTPKNFTGMIRMVLWKGIKALANGARMIEQGKSQEIWSESVICACRKRAG